MKKSRMYFNIFLVWMLTGFWHGAAWNFIIWGLYFAILLIIEKRFLLKYLDNTRFFSRIYVLIAVMISFVIFNGTSMGIALSDIGGLVGVGGIPIVSTEAVYYLKSYFVIFILAIIGATPIPKRIVSKSKLIYYLEPVGLILLLIMCTAYLVDGSFNPFLYFRF